MEKVSGGTSRADLENACRQALINAASCESGAVSCESGVLSFSIAPNPAPAPELENIIKDAETNKAEIAAVKNTLLMNAARETLGQANKKASEALSLFR